MTTKMYSCELCACVDAVDHDLEKENQEKKPLTKCKKCTHIKCKKVTVFELQKPRSLVIWSSTMPRLLRTLLLVGVLALAAGKATPDDEGCSFSWKAMGCTPSSTCKLKFRPWFGTFGPCVLKTSTAAPKAEEECPEKAAAKATAAAAEAAAAEPAADAPAAEEPPPTETTAAEAAPAEEAPAEQAPAESAE